jgi:nitrous oxidase accessory protein NosD
VIIAPNGSLSNLSAPLSRNGSTYTLTGNLTGGLQDERNGSTVDGAGYWVSGNLTTLTYAVLLDGVSQVSVVGLVLNVSPMLVIDSSNITVRALSDPPGSGLSTPLWVLLSSQVLIEASQLQGEPGSALIPLTPQTPIPGLTLGNPALAIEVSPDVQLLDDNLTGGKVGLWAIEDPALTLDRVLLAANVSAYSWSPCGPGHPPTIVSAGIFDMTNDSTFQSVSAISPPLNASECYTVPATLDLEMSVGVTLFQSTLLEAYTTGVFVFQCSNVTVESVDGSNLPMGIGIQVYETTAFSLDSNQFSDGLSGAVAYEVGESSDGVLYENQADSTGTGANLVDAYEVDVVNNSLSGDLQDAVSLTEDDLCSVSGNDLSGGAYAPNGTGLVVVNSTRLELVNNTIGDWSSPSYGAVLAVDLRDSTIGGNLASGAPVGIHLEGSYDDSVSHNIAQDGGTTPGDAEILLNDSGRLRVEGNQLQYGRVGILGQGGGDSLLLDNNLSFNTEAGLRWMEFENLTIQANVIVDDGDGVDLVDGALYSIVDDSSSNLDFPCSTCVGVFLEQVSDGLVTASNFSTMNIGVYAVYALNLSVSASEIYSAGYGVLAGETTNLTVRNLRGGNDIGGVEADFCRNVLLANNSFGGSIAVGLELMDSTNATVTGNTAVHSLGDGLALWSVTDAYLANNTLSSDLLGLRLENSTGVNVVANVLANCSTSFRIVTSSTVGFVHNSFENDRNWTIGAGSFDLSWDGGYPIGGNYWSNATGTDTQSGPSQNQPGADGILDTPFAIGGYGMDRYPLAAPWDYPSIVVVAKGLPPGTAWSVRLTYGGYGSGSAQFFTDGTQVSWAVPYAAWVPVTYTVGYVAGYVPQPRSAPFSTGPGVVTVTIPFVTFLLPVSFEETGLSPGTNWSVTVDGTTLSGSGPELNTTLPNGSYSYSLSAIAGYYRLTGGSFGVFGGPVEVALVYTAVEFVVEFVEFGLPNGTSWRLTFDGNTQTSTVPAFEYSVTNGSYSYRVGPVTGFSVSPENGSLSMRGNPVVVRIEFTAPAPPPPAAPPPPSHLLDEELGALAAVFAALAVAGWLWAVRQRQRGGPEAGSEPAPGPSEPFQPFEGESEGTAPESPPYDSTS